jgi:type I restriction enzyme S subunit
MYVIKKILELKERFDVRYHTSDKVEIKDFWLLSEIKDIIVRDPICYGFSYSRIGIPIIRISDLKQPFIDFTNVAKISEDVHAKYSKTHLKPYDILVSVRGISTGKVGIFLGEFQEANISPNIIIIRLKEIDLSAYVAMFLVSELGQSQIKQFISGAGKPSLTAPMINRIQIPVPSKDELKQINDLFENAKNERLKASKILYEIKGIFNNSFNNFSIKKNLFSIKNISDLKNRWDPHYNNDSYVSLRKYFNSNSLKSSKINNVVDFIDDVVKLENKEQKYRYIEINSVNNLTGIIEDSIIDYPDRLPDSPKVELINGDILISKVRPYLNTNTIFVDNEDNMVSVASKNAFSVFRTTNYYYKYYLTAFLRYELGLQQIIMYQSGTSYPTVSDDDINNIKIPSIEEDSMIKINDLYKRYVEIKIVEEYTKKTILELLDELE